MKPYSILALLAINLSSHEPYQKIYLNKDSILCDQDNIFVHVNNSWVQTYALRQDSQGYFVKEKDLNSNFFWVCENGHTNPRWNSYCPACLSTPRKG